MTGNSGHKAAQRKFKAEECETCGGTMTLQRHHIDRDPLNNSLENMKILCQTCHKDEHQKAGDWGKGKVPEVKCEICGKAFQPKRRRRSILCGSAECTKQKGKLSAALRWA